MLRSQPVLRATAIALALLLAACPSHPPSLKVASATEVGVVPHSPTIQGRDGGNSALLWGKVVWDFGDTPLNVPDQRGSQWHSNSMSFTDDLDASDGLAGMAEHVDAAGAPRMFVPNTPLEDSFNQAHEGDPCEQMPCGARWAIWPGAMLFDAPRSRALIFYGVVSAAPGDFNFEGVGQGLAVWTGLDVEVTRPEVRPGTDHPTALFGKDEPAWGAAAVIDGEHVYGFAPTGGSFTPQCKLARVPVAQALERAAWTFWDGGSWSSDPGKAGELFSCAPIVSVSRNAAVGGWLAVYSAPFSNEVRYRTAPALTGPWSDDALAFTADRKGQDGTSYDALEHPEYALQGGKVVFVTFTRPNGEGWFGSDLVIERVELQ